MQEINLSNMNVENLNLFNTLLFNTFNTYMYVKGITSNVYN